jgi:replicative DNA helicase
MESIQNAEAALLSCVINNPALLAEIETEISEEDFSRGQHRVLFRDIIEMWQKGISIDLMTVINNSKVDNKLINNISDVVLITSNYNEYLKIVKKASKTRKVARLSLEMHRESESLEDVNEFIAKYQQKFMELTETRVSCLQNGEEAIKKYHQVQNSDIKGVTTGLYSLDQYFQMNPGDLITLGAFSGIGKTALGNQIAFNNIVNGLSVLTVSLEMEAEEIIGRIKNSYDLEELYDTNFHIYTPPTTTVQDILATGQQIKYKYGLGLILIDYIQLIRGVDNLKRNEQIAEISRNLKQIARQLHVPILALSQLNAEGLLRESRDLENDSNVTMILDRPDYRKWQSIDYQDDENLDKNYAVLKIKKNRGGETGGTYLRFNPEKQIFDEI